VCGRLGGEGCGGRGVTGKAERRRRTALESRPTKAGRTALESRATKAGRTALESRASGGRLEVPAEGCEVVDVVAFGAGAGVGLVAVGGAELEVHAGVFVEEDFEPGLGVDAEGGEAFEGGEVIDVGEDFGAVVEFVLEVEAGEGFGRDGVVGAAHDLS